MQMKKQPELRGSMRKSYLKSFAIVAAIALTVSGTALADPLAPGKPAGVHAAQMGDKEWLVFGGIAAVAAVVLIASAGGGHQSVAAPVITVVTPATS
jgi:hypothetical protein